VKRISLKGKKKNKVDKKLFWLVTFLVFFGVVAIADVSAPQALTHFSDELYFAKSQFAWSILGMFLLVIVSNIHYSFWKKLAIPIFFISSLLLVLVWTPLGVKSLGARRWISIAGNSFQPSEFMKFALILYLAKVSESKKEILSYLVPVGIAVLLIMVQPDLGTTLVILGIAFSQMFVAGIETKYFLASGLVAGVGSFLLVIFSGYRKQRLLTFFTSMKNPLEDPMFGQTLSSYHVRQILLALGSGGLFGVGLGQSRQKYLFLPEAATDSIFAVLAEEIGFVGSTALILLFAWFVVRGLKIAKGAPDKFSQIFSVGVVVWIATQTFLNIGSMVSLTPLTGLPLPLISYGGTALVTTLMGIGILLNISKYGRQKN